MYNLTSVDSSNVAALGKDGNDLVVEFHSGGIYRYPGKAYLYHQAIAAESVGRFINYNLVHNKAEFIKVN